MADFSGNFDIFYDEEHHACGIRFRCFDTPNCVTVFGCSVPDYDIEGLLLEIRRLCLRFHRCWSFSLPDSDVCRINHADGRVRVDECTARLLSAMKRFHGEEPVFDFTAAPVSLLWKRARAVPDDAEIAAALSHVGADKIIIDGCDVVKLDPLAQVDVGGAAKGYAADEIARLLRGAGVACAHVDLGGNLHMIGSHPTGRPWRVSVRDPITGGSAGMLEVVDRSVVTSGSYERFSEIDGVRYHHIIDLRTGKPAESGVVSATVVGESSLVADMLATTALLVNPKELQRRHPCEQLASVIRLPEGRRRGTVRVVG